MHRGRVRSEHGLQSLQRRRRGRTRNGFRRLGGARHSRRSRRRAIAGGGRSRRRKGTARRNCRRLVESPCGRRSWGSRRTVHWRRDFSGRGLRPPSRTPDLPSIRRCPGLALARRFHDGDHCRFARRGLKGPIVLKFDLGKIRKDSARRTRRGGFGGGRVDLPDLGRRRRHSTRFTTERGMRKLRLDAPRIHAQSRALLLSSDFDRERGWSALQESPQYSRKNEPNHPTRRGQCAVDVDQGKPIIGQ